MEEFFQSNDIVKVLLPIATGDGYDYIIPTNIQKIKIGSFVKVPLRNKTEFGIIIGKGDSNLEISKIKPIISVFDKIQAIKTDMIAFLKKVADYTMSPLGNVFDMLMPNEKLFLQEKMEDIYNLSDNYKEIFSKLSSARQTEAKKRIIEFLESAKETNSKNFIISDLSYATGTSTSVIKNLVDSGILTKSQQIKNNINPEDFNFKYNENSLKLSDTQYNSYKEIKDYYEDKNFAVCLLDGITGSGKTEIYFKIIADILNKNQDGQVLIMLPEIALTSQFLSKFKIRFGVYPTLWHSNLSNIDRIQNYKSIANGLSRIIVGTRSALFLPYKNLSMIVIDEEHDGSYKQEDGVIYNARDMAVLRCSIEKIPILLVSATPSIESYNNSIIGKYKIVKLNTRFAESDLPTITLVDMKQAENKPKKAKDNDGVQSWLSPVVIKKIEDEIISGNQVMIFLNRRGYAPLLMCSKCGYKVKCPNCDISLVSHNVKTIKSEKQNDKNEVEEIDILQGRIQCHHCGYTSSIHRKCPECGNEDSFILCGPGVDRISEEINKLFPKYNSIIISSDTVNTEKKLNTAIKSISDKEIDIIIGTQILAKGHHFPNLTLVVIVDGDMGIAGDDFRGSEKTFALLHQVSGRAGRESKQSEVLIQTYNPDNKVMQMLQKNDKENFIKMEIKDRQLSGMPPFGKLSSIILSSPQLEILNDFCKLLKNKTPNLKTENNTKKFRIMGPVDAPISFLRGQYRKRFLIHCKNYVSMQKLISIWLNDIKIPSQIKLKIDIDPYNFM